MKAYRLFSSLIIVLAPACASFLPKSSSGEDQSTEDASQQGAEGLQVEESKRAMLVDSYLNNTRALIAEGKYREAQTMLGEARALDPQNSEIKKLAGDLAVLRDKESGQMDSFRIENQRKWDLQAQALGAEAQEAMSRAQRFLDEQKYNEAIQELQVVLSHIKWSPLKGQWDSVEAQARNMLSQAEREKEAHLGEQRRIKEEETYRRLKETEERENTRKRETLRLMLVKAIEAYDHLEFEDCVAICDRALEIEPRSEEAKELREAAWKSARDQSKKDYINKKREQFRRWHEDMSELRIPYNDYFNLPDQEFWNSISKKRAKRSGATTTASESEESKRLREQIKTTTIPSLNVKDEVELENVIGILRTYTGLPLIVDPAASDAVRSGSIVFNLPIENPITVKDALDILVESTGGTIAYVFKHDAILVTSTEKAKGSSSVRNHDIQDLVFGLTDFSGPDLSTLAETLSGGSKGAETAPFGGALPEPKKIVNPEELVQMIKDTIAPGTWDADGHRLESFNGNLIAVHTEEVHQQIEHFLNDMRKFSSSIVTIEAKFFTVSENFIQQFGVDFRGLGGQGNGSLATLDDVSNGLEDNSSLGFDNGGSGLSSGTGAAGNPSAGAFLADGKSNYRARTEGIFDNPLGNLLTTSGGGTFQISILDDTQLNLLIRMIEKTANAQTINSNTLSTYNGQRAFVTVINQTTYIADYDVDVSTAAFVADPQISIIPDGISLDVRPTIHQDRKYITLELQPTVATLIRPIQEFQTTLAGITNPVTIQLPELQVSSAHTTAVVPDGGSLLIGGLKKIRKVERSSDVPFFSQIPLIGALFSNQGVSEESESLMVLVRAYITDVKAEAKKLANR